MLDCRECLGYVRKLRERARMAQKDLGDNGKDLESLHQMQFYEGQIHLAARIESYLERRVEDEQG